MTISRIGDLFPQYRIHFNATSYSACVKSMGKSEKHGKTLYKFFQDAVQGSQWRTNSDLGNLLKCCIAHKGLVSGKYKEKFKKVQKVFEKEIKRASRAPENAPAQAEVKIVPPGPNPLEAIAIREFEEQIAPAIQERFAGMGGMSSSGYENAMTQA